MHKEDKYPDCWAWWSCHPHTHIHWVCANFNNNSHSSGKDRNSNEGRRSACWTATLRTSCNTSCGMDNLKQFRVQQNLFKPELQVSTRVLTMDPRRTLTSPHPLMSGRHIRMSSRPAAVGMGIGMQNRCC